MSYYRGDGRGDYYRGDFWSKLGKGIKKFAKKVAPIASIFIPAVGAGTLVGRAVAAHGRATKARDTARSLVASVAQPRATALSQVPNPPQLLHQPLGELPSTTPKRRRRRSKPAVRRRRTSTRRRPRGRRRLRSGRFA